MDRCAFSVVDALQVWVLDDLFLNLKVTFSVMEQSEFIRGLKLAA